MPYLIMDTATVMDMVTVTAMEMVMDMDMENLRRSLTHMATGTIMGISMRRVMDRSIMNTDLLGMNMSMIMRDVRSRQ